MQKAIYVDRDEIKFDDGSSIFSDHEQDCCEQHYLDFSTADLSDFEGLLFDLESDKFFEAVEDYGIRLIPSNNGHPVSIPGYGYNNGYYSENLTLVVSRPGREQKRYNITRCQVVKD